MTMAPKNCLLSLIKRLVSDVEPGSTFVFVLMQHCFSGPRPIGGYALGPHFTESVL